jgi:predicted nucleic acid-binding protein
MRSVGRLYLDTNIFIVAFERQDEVSQQLSKLLEVANRNGERRCVTSELTLSELLVAPYQNNDMPLVDVYNGFVLNSQWLHVLPVGLPILQYSAMLRARHSGLKLPDAIHVATAIGAGCSHLLTGDLGIRGEYGFESLRVDASPLTVLRPDEPTLTSLLQSLAE